MTLSINERRCSSEVYEDETGFIQQWVEELLDCKKTIFSFQYGDRPSSDMLSAPITDCGSGEWVEDARLHTLAWRDEATGLVCTLEVTEYRDFPAVEWLVRFHNEGTTDTPILSDIQAMDLCWRGLGPGVPVLHHARGSDERPDDFQYISDEMRTLRTEGRTIRMASSPGQECEAGKRDGRSSVDWLPFFNLQTGEDGIALAVGWSGQWAAEFVHDGEGNVRVKAGMERTHLTLHPGESFRTPRIMLLYWRGEPIHGHNVLRQFILRHHTPQQNGQPVVAPICNGSWGGAHTEAHLGWIETIAERALPYDYYWIDAGWYGTSEKPCPDVFHGDWAITGDWRVNKNYHPAGLRPISDAVRRVGMKFLLWIEPERATAGTPVTLEHPDWFMTMTGAPPQPNESLLLDLGNPDARSWAIETVTSVIGGNGIDCYREDFNFFGSGQAFAAKDTADRMGITEIRFVEGLYEFWDELHRRYPNLLIDNCASGGRRIDLETISRSIALWRTDYNCFPWINPDAFQVHSCGLAYWVPLNATSPAAKPGDTYRVRSAMSAGLVFSLEEFGTSSFPDDDEHVWAWMHKMMEEYRRARPYWYGDYYPLMSCSLAPDTWMAYQLHRPDLDEGVVLAFRRLESPLTSASLELKGLTSGAEYLFEDVDSGDSWRACANQTMALGLDVAIAERRASRMLFYKRA
jgi:alpha-galactosidase